MHATESLVDRPVTRLPRPVVIGHRGASAYRPEHTAASFELAIDLGADFVEPDVVVSRDGVLVVRHENELSRSTDIAEHPEFADRRTTRLVDGQACTGWFTEDFDLAELRTLRSIEGMPALRPLNTAYDGRFGILTLAEVVELARCRSTAERPIRVLAELKHPEWCAAAGMSMAELVADELHRLGADHADGTVMMQAFDTALLRELRARLGDEGPRMAQLVDDHPASDALVSPSGLREISTYAQAVAPSRERVLASAAASASTGSPHLVTQAHAAQLAVFCWTLRSENAYLPEHLRRGEAPGAIGDGVADAAALLALGVDGLITDFPDHAVRARTAVTAQLV
jgi:glycerophosphoryl diester phosphodiesterase